MVSLRPDVAGRLNEMLALAACHAMLRSLFLTSCGDACGAEGMDMGQCIRTCSDRADICAAAARLAVRRTGQNMAML